MKNRIFSSNVFFVVLLLVVIGLPVLGIFFIFLENEKPVVKVDIPGETIYIGSSTAVPVSFSDGKRGLRKARIEIVKEGKVMPFFEKEYEKEGFFKGGKSKNDLLNLSIEPAKIGLADGKAVLRMNVWDYSWQRWWNGNITTVEKDIVFDTKRPEMDILSGIQNLNQGGTGIVIYKLSESCERNGVYAGGNYFPGYGGLFHDKNIYISFFALEYNKGPGTEIYAEAADMAGNGIRRGFKVFIKEKKFRKDSLNISDEFLNAKMPEFDRPVPKDSKTPLADKFLSVNRDLRAENYEKIKEIVKNTEKKLLWEGVFTVFPNAKNMAGFADHRDYNYQGRHIDSQVHLGVDLASVTNAPVPAANKGRVVFTGEIGIYGKTVFLDHGCGLFSMYSHLNDIDVKDGQTVEKSDVLGRSGSTGLAAGDHLHFSILVNGIFVNPLEWWDASWIKNNVTSKIEAAGAAN